MCIISLTETSIMDENAMPQSKTKPRVHYKRCQIIGQQINIKFETREMKPETNRNILHTCVCIRYIFLQINLTIKWISK